MPSPCFQYTAYTASGSNKLPEGFKYFEPVDYSLDGLPSTSKTFLKCITSEYAHLFCERLFWWNHWSPMLWGWASASWNCWRARNMSQPPLSWSTFKYICKPECKVRSPTHYVDPSHTAQAHPDREGGCEVSEGRAALLELRGWVGGGFPL